MMRPLGLAILFVLAAAPATADGIAPGTYDYFVHHTIHGLIGEHRMVVARDGDDLVIEHETEIAVGLLFVTVHRRDGHYREVWRGGRLVAFDGVTEENGRVSEVRARAEGDRLRIEGPAGVTLAPADVGTTQPSHIGAIERPRFMRVGTGEVIEAEVRPADREAVMVAGRPMAALRFALSGELGRDIWFDDGGIWLKWQLQRGGGTVTLMRQ